MLSELAGGDRKSVQHVLVHLLPYLGGKATLAALRVDSPDDPECRVCYKDVATADGLTGLRESLSAAQLQACTLPSFNLSVQLVCNKVVTAADGLMGLRGVFERCNA